METIVFESLLLTFHVLSVILWIGATVGALALFQRKPSDHKMYYAVLHRWTHPAMALAWVTGLVMVWNHWQQFHSIPGWLHPKLTLVVLLSGLHGMVSGRLRKGTLKSAPWASIFTLLALLTLLALQLGRNLM